MNRWIHWTTSNHWEFLMEICKLSKLRSKSWGVWQTIHANCKVCMILFRKTQMASLGWCTGVDLWDATTAVVSEEGSSPAPFKIVPTFIGMNKFAYKGTKLFLPWWNRRPEMETFLRNYIRVGCAVGRGRFTVKLASLKYQGLYLYRPQQGPGRTIAMSLHGHMSCELMKVNYFCVLFL